MEEVREDERWETYAVRQRHRRARPMLPAYPLAPGLDLVPHPDESEGGGGGGRNGEEGEGPAPIYAYRVNVRAYTEHMRQRQRKRRRVTASTEAAILRLLHEVSPTACSSGDCCAICLEDFAGDAAGAADLRGMPTCSHVFHQHCILKWLRRNAVCPVCRRHLPSTETQEEEDDEEEEELERTIRRGLDDWAALVARARATATPERGRTN